MAFFKFRKGADAAPAATAQPESVEALRRRARHRLIGAAVLVLVGIVGFPLLFDTQPRPIAVDIPIEIPDRAKAKPLPAPPQPRAQGVVTDAAPPTPTKVAAAPASASAPAKTPASAATASATPAAPATPAAAMPEPSKAAAVQQARAEPAPKPVDAPRQPARDGARAQAALEAKDSARAQAALEGKTVAAQADGRFVVQVGAFSDVGKAREARQRVEKAGLKTYTQVAETRDGRRIRVRVGPFASRADADKAASRIKGLDLPAAILTL